VANGFTEIDLSEDGLLARASEIVGATNFGAGFRDNLRALLVMYNTSACLTPKGRKSTRRRLIELLTNRLLIEQAFENHPEIRKRRIERPVYLVGLPRTGTSAFFNLLASDPVSRPLLLWEGKYPNPIEGKRPGEPDPRMLALCAGLSQFYEKNPEFAKIHYARADGPEECVQLLAHTLGSVQMGIEPLISPYQEYFQAQDQRANYAYYRELLKLLDWQRPGERWLLKSPAHLWAIDVLLEFFPDACLVWAHRNPVELVPSYCSMIEALSSLREPVDRRAIGPSVLEYLARSVERAMSARDVLPPGRFFDVRYDDFVAAPMRVVEETYAAFGLPLGTNVRERMRLELAASPRNRHGQHRYTLEEFGLTRDQVRTRFAGYTARFGSSA
jgi:hypothetical protein